VKINCFGPKFETYHGKFTKSFDESAVSRRNTYSTSSKVIVHTSHPADLLCDVVEQREMHRPPKIQSDSKSYCTVQCEGAFPVSYLSNGHCLLSLSLTVFCFDCGRGQLEEIAATYLWCPNIFGKMCSDYCRRRMRRVVILVMGWRHHFKSVRTPRYRGGELRHDGISWAPSSTLERRNQFIGSSISPKIWSYEF
jgi:hypothetical protein